MTSEQRVQRRESSGYNGYRVQRVLGTGHTFLSTIISTYLDRYLLQLARSSDDQDMGERVCLYPLYPLYPVPVYPLVFAPPEAVRCRA